MSAIDLKIITLNCWGVFTPLACEKRHERLAAIAETLSEGKHDIVFLQEIWTDGDFEKIRKVMRKSYPEAHYFHSNLIGSGCCIFSKHTIAETLYFRYGANGYPHRVQHGDWFGGKGVGMARIRLPGGSLVACYVTHLHAQYNRQQDEYLAHRISQAYELAAFVRLTSPGADAVLLCGDMNLQPRSLGMRLLLANSGLADAWLAARGLTAGTGQQQQQQQQQEEEDGEGEDDDGDEDEDAATCERPGNSFRGKEPCPQRLDYVLFASCAGSVLRCLGCRLALGTVPNQQYSYSDHEAVEADFQLRRDVTSPGSGVDARRRRRVLTNCVPVLRAAVGAAGGHRIYYAAMLLLVVLVVFCSNKLFAGCCIATLITAVGSMCAAYLLVTIVVLKKAEMRALLNTQLCMERLLAAEDSSG